MSENIKFSFDPCWFDAPQERTHVYFPTFVGVSIAVQSSMRRLIPERFFSDIERLRDTRKAYPLLVYAASRPFPGQPRTEFTYDLLNKTTMRKFYFGVHHNLPILLASVAQRLRAAGMAEVARSYRPDRARTIVGTVTTLRICRRRMEALLIAESFMVNSLLRFAGSAALPPRMQSKIVLDCQRVWLSRLRRLFSDCRDLAPAVLAAATEALKSGLGDGAEAA